MSAQPDAVIRRWFEEVWNQGKEATIGELFPADAIAHGTPGGEHKGGESFLPLFRSFRGAFRDLHIAVEQTVMQGEHVAVYCRITGTHSGATLGIEPTGRKIEFCGVTFGRVVEGRFREAWNCYDLLTMYQQIGVVAAIPSPVVMSAVQA